VDRPTATPANAPGQGSQGAAVGMGCFGSKARKSASSEADGGRGGYEMGQGVVTVSNGRVVREKPTRDYHKPQWKTEDPAMTKERLAEMRDEFWFTQPHYGGSKEIWDALKAAFECQDMATTRVIIDSAGIVVAAPDMTVCYDERGAKYEIPMFIVCDPVNLASAPHAARA